MSVNKEESNLVHLGDYIELCDERNSDGNYTLDDVRGISILKKLIPTKADMQDVSLSPYKLLKPREFSYVTVTSRNGGKISLAINDSNQTFIVSSSYEVFKSINKEELLPEYLYILLSREEFDRLSRFNSWGSARETFDWSELCRIQIPLPDPDIQQELVDTYNGLKALAEQNEALIKPLTEACQAYIVDCKKKYPEVELGEYIEEYDKRNSDKKIKAVKSVSITKEFKETGAKVNKDELEGYKLVPPRHLSYVQTTKNEKCFANALNTTNETYVVTQVNRVIRSKDETVLNIGFLHLIFRGVEFDRYAIFNSWGSARETFDWNELCRVRIPLPPPEVQQAIVNIYNCAEEAKKIATEAREKMKMLCPALVQRAING
ncbi:MAG: restriction endonuclease subunit S [Bacteroidetes bacterium]|nr:restriction endonuclease subunit S [Bacteroidota bacterium]